MISKIAYFIALPLLATAIVGADTLRTHSLINAAANVRAATTESHQDVGLGQTLSAHYFQLNENDQLTGQVFAIDDQTGQSSGVGSLDVFLVQHSRVIVQTVTDASGQFTTPQAVPPGTYTFCAAGDDGFLAYGIHVDEGSATADNAGTGEALPPPSNDTGDADEPSGPFSNIAFQDEQPQGTSRITAAVVPPQFTSLKEIMENYVPADVGQSISQTARSKINVEKSVVEGGYQINLDADGKLVGRIGPIASDEDIEIRLREMNVFLIKDDSIYRDASVDENGQFELLNVEPGIYGFAAAGRDGFAALSFQAVAPDLTEARNDPDNPFRPASNKSGVQENGGLQIAISPESDVPFIRNQINRLNQDDEGVAAAAPQPPPPFGAGAFGAAGAAGGAGGYGGLTGFVEAALAAWILSEAFQDNNEAFFTVPAPISPF